MASSPKRWTLIAEYLKVPSLGCFFPSFSLLIFPTKLTTLRAIYLQTKVKLSLLTKTDLQLVTDQFSQWADENRMEHKIDKCKSITSGGKLASSDPLLLEKVLFLQSIQSVTLESSCQILFHGTTLIKKLVAAKKTKVIDS